MQRLYQYIAVQIGVMFEMRVLLATTGFLIAFAAQAVVAQDVGISENMAQARFTVGGRDFLIARSQNTEATLKGEFAKTSRPCPDFCIQPMIAAPGVATIGELELIAFLQGDVAANTGLLIDARLPDWFAKAAIPAAVNVPFAALDPQNPYQTDILRALGAEAAGDLLDFTNAKSLVVYDNGAWDAQGSRAITDLIAAGYPAAKILNYRGGLEDWLHLGLSTILP